jgi:hypothetical protein
MTSWQPRKGHNKRHRELVFLGCCSGQKGYSQ